MNKVLRNMVVVNPAGLLLGGGLGSLVSHRVGGILAVVMILLGVVISLLPCFSRFVDRHSKLAFVLAAAAWLVAAGRVGWFWARVTM